MRNRFEEQLEVLHLELIKMGALCEEAISAAAKALFKENREMAEKCFSTEEEIDQKERDIEALCMKLLMQQQPVARDLRLISSALKMISDMERIGDQAADIAEITMFIHDNDARSKIHIQDMASAASQMVTDSIESFVKKDLQLAQVVMEADDEVDRLFDKVKEELISILTEDATQGEVCIDLLMIAKYLERIGDHAVNIAEWVEYSIIGKHRKEKEI